MPIDASTLLPNAQITTVYIAYYDRAPDPAGLQFWVDQLEGGRSIEQIATDFSSAAETIEKYPYFDAPELASGDAFITSIYVNLFGRAPDDAGLEFWTDQLESGTTPVGEIILAIFEGAQSEAEGGFPDKETLLNKVDVGLDWAVTAANAGIGTSSNLIAEDVDGTLVVYDQSAFESATSILDGVTEDPETVAAAKADTVAYFDGAANEGDTFVLTTGQDDILGTAGNDAIIGVLDGAANTYTLGDVIDGGAGTDSLIITTDQTDISLASATLNNVEVFEVDSRSNDIGTIDVASEDIDTLSVNGNGRMLNGDVTIDNINTSTDVGLTNFDADNQDVEVNYNETADPFDVTFSLVDIDDADVFVDMDFNDDGTTDSDVFNLTLDGVMNTDGDMDFYTTDAETFNVTVVSASELENIGNYYADFGDFGPTVVNLVADADLVVAGFWDLTDTSDVATTFNISGAGNVHIDDFDDGSSDVTVDGSTATGNLTLLDADKTFLSVTTGSGDDEVEVENSSTAVSVGVGDDKVSVLEALILDTSGATDVVDASFDGGDGTDTFEISAANALLSETNVDASADDVAVSDAFANFEALSLTSFAGQDIDATTWGLADDVTLADGYGTGGSLTVNNNATVTLNEGTNTDISLIVDGAGDAGSDDDSLVVELISEDGDDYSDVTIADVETVDVISSEIDDDDTVDTNTMDLIAVNATTLNISGEAALDLQEANTDLAAVDTVDASGFDAGLTIDLTSSGEAVTVTTGAGADDVVGSAQADTISVGNGGNTVTGAGGADDITLGDGVTEDDVDTIAYTAVTDSQGVTVDMITGFQVDVQSTDDVNNDGTVDADDIINDLIDLSAIAGGAGTYLGEADGYGAVLTSLTGGGGREAVLDISTSTVYVDVNGDGALTDADMAINLTGVTDLSADNFTF